MFIESDSGNTPFRSANDRSRWSAIRALGDYGTYEIDQVVIKKSGRVDGDWQSIDMVMHTNKNGEMRRYSSKPTLLPTILAYEYICLKKISSLNIKEINDNLYFVVQFILIVNQMIPLAISFLLIGLMIEQLCTSDFGRIFIMASATFGTYLSTFAITLNNHVPAACAVTVGMFCLFQIWQMEKQNAFWYALCGLSAAFAAANELPALSFLGIALLATLFKSPVKSILAFVPFAAVVAGAFFATNFNAHGQWKPAYTFRHDGKVIGSIEDPAASSTLDAGSIPEIDFDQPTENQPAYQVPSESAEVIQSKYPLADGVEKRWQIVEINPENNQVYRLAVVKPTGSEKLEVREWENWYDYPSSYWLEGRKQGVDVGEPDRGLYTFHVLIGHHGIFSLTPIWILAAIGLFLGIFGSTGFTRWFCVSALLITVVVVTFYIMRPQVDRNYGGVSSTLRWLLWLAPMWLIGMCAIFNMTDRSMTFKCFAALLLLISFFSAFYPCVNPWQSPWLYELVEWDGMVPVSCDIWPYLQKFLS